MPRLYPENPQVIPASPIVFPQQARADNGSKLLIMCGGGGRPSADLFFSLVNSSIPNIRTAIRHLDCTVVTGPYAKPIKFNDENTKVIPWSNNMLKLMREATVIIGEAGYFSLHEIIANEKSAICVPGDRRMDNQELRATKFEELGMGFCIMPEEGEEKLTKKAIELFSDRTLRVKQQRLCREYTKKLLLQKTIAERLLDEIISKKKSNAPFLEVSI